MTEPTNNNPPVPLAPARRLLYFRSTLIPAVVWLGAVGLSAGLIKMSGSAYEVYGIVTPQEASLLTLRSARVISVSKQLHDEVKPGEIVALLDDVEVQRQVAILDAQAKELESQIAAQREKLIADRDGTEQQHKLSERRLEIDLNTARLASLDRRVQLESSKIQLQSLRLEQARSEQLLKAGVKETSEFDTIRLQADALEKRIMEGEKALDVAQVQLDDAARRMAEYEKTPLPYPNIDGQVLPLERQVDVYAAQAALANAQLPALVLRSPIKGVVTELAVAANTNVLAGSAVARITSQESSTLVAYLPENAPHTPKAGDEVTVTAVSQRGHTAKGKVQSLGPAVVQFPAPLNAQPTRPQYGRPVVVAFEPGSPLIPGEKVMVSFAR